MIKKIISSLFYLFFLNSLSANIFVTYYFTKTKKEFIVFVQYNNNKIEQIIFSEGKSLKCEPVRNGKKTISDYAFLLNDHNKIIGRFPYKNSFSDFEKQFRTNDYFLDKLIIDLNQSLQK